MADQKLALVFSGGGAKGAFGVGVLNEIATRYPTLRWQIVAGTSTGALIAPFAALASADRSALADLRNFYLNATQKTILESNLGGFFNWIKAIADLPEGLYNLSPLRKAIDKYFSDARLAQLTNCPTACITNSVNLQTGDLGVCVQDNFRADMDAWFKARGDAVLFTQWKSFRSLIRASASMPAIMDPIEYHPTGSPLAQLVDGGVLDVAPLRSAIAAGATKVVVVLMSPRSTVKQTAAYTNLLTVALRSIDLITDEVLRGDVEYAQLLSTLSTLGAMLRTPSAALPPEVAAWLSVNKPMLDSWAAKRPLQVEVIEPEVGLGETLDFDSRVSPSWPLPGAAGAGSLGIMSARFNYGARRAAQEILARPSLKAMLESA